MEEEERERRDGGNTVTEKRYIFYDWGRGRKIHHSEGSQAVPARPSGKDRLVATQNSGT